MIATAGRPHSARRLVRPWVAAAIVVAFAVAGAPARGVPPEGTASADPILAVGWRRPVDRAAANRVLLAAGAIPLAGIEEIAVDLVTPAAGGTVAPLARRLTTHPAVEFVEPRRWGVTLTHLKPDDPLRRIQYQLDHVRAPRAWDVYPRTLRRPKRGPIVAVIDTGFDATHPDLEGQAVQGRRYWTEGCGSRREFYHGLLQDPLAFVSVAEICSNRVREDDNGHGTSVGSVIAARTDNGIGMASIAYNARLLPMKCADERGRVDMVACSAAITEAVSLGARVINMSYGGVLPSLTHMRATEFAYLRGAVLVAARGNSASAAPMWPACEPHVIGVTATDRKRRLAGFSSHGGTPLCTYVAAPGDRILAATASIGSYGQPSGTSLAAPAVAAAVALAIGRDPDLTPDDVLDRLARCSRDLGRRGYDDAFGYGLVDAYRLLTCR